MGLTNDGRDLIGAALVGAAYNAYNNANSYIGIGSGSTAFAATQSDLQGGTKTRKAMEATYPTQVDNVLTFKSVFATTDHNAAVEEWGIFNASSAGDMLCRKAESLGTKTSAQAWEVTATITVTAA